VSEAGEEAREKRSRGGKKRREDKAKVRRARRGKERACKRKVWVYGPVGREDRGKEFWGYMAK
jgi:hypothetical protein